MHILVAYDISNPRRLQKVARIMEDFGSRVQLSVFEMELASRSLLALQQKVLEVIEPEMDGVKYYTICESCAQGIIALGNSKTGWHGCEFDIV